MNCPSCKSKIREKSVLLSANQFIAEDQANRINDFLPNEFQAKSKQYCDSCLQIDSSNQETYVINSKFNKFYNELSELKESVELEEKISELSEDIAKTEVIYADSFLASVKLYSTAPDEISQEKFIESQIILDTGMWSTSSDNLDAVWSAVHDSIARKGTDTDNKLQSGFNQAQLNLKRAAAFSRCNTIIDFKHTFSELAGNGKILIYTSGMAGIEKSRELPNFSITNDKRKSLDEMVKRNKKLREYLNSIHPKKFKNLIRTIKNEA